MGGDHVSNDLAYGLKVPLGRAEQLKLEHGAAVARRRVQRPDHFLAKANSGCRRRRINLEHLRRIMSLRLEETFQLIEAELAHSGLLDHLRAGVFICGGGARIPGITNSGREYFSIAGFPRKDKLDQRPQIGARPAGIRDGHRAGQIWLVPAKETRSGLFGKGIKKTFGEISTAKNNRI